MKSKNSIPKVATDMSWLQLSWSTWFISFVFIAYIVLGKIIGNSEVSQESFLTFAYSPSKVYMLVIGIVSVSSFLTFYVKQGITRKDYFFGAAISSVIVSLILMIIAGIGTSIEQLFIPTLEIVSFVGTEASWLLTVVVFSLNILVYYIAGWLIGAGFYRFGGIGGMLYIILAVVAVSTSDILWEFELKNPLKKLLHFNNQWGFPLSVSFIGTFLLLAIVLWIIRFTTKRVRIKMK
jgi:hypothetical protein